MKIYFLVFDVNKTLKTFTNVSFSRQHSPITIHTFILTNVKWQCGVYLRIRLPWQRTTCKQLKPKQINLFISSSIRVFEYLSDLRLANQ